jgi:ferrochelatase
MPLRPEPRHTHGSIPQTAVVLVNLGTPDEPTRGAVRRYLKEFLSDPRVVEIPRAVWWFILNLVILPFRSGQSAKKYATIWEKEGSPLRIFTERQAQRLATYLADRGHENLHVLHAMRYGGPSLPQVLDEAKQRGCDQVLVLPAYPQYSSTTTGSIYDAVFAHYKQVRNLPALRLVKHYHDHDGYIDALGRSVETYWDQYGKPDKLVMSFHGIPKRTLELGDPYYCECRKTARLLAARLRIREEHYVVTFQSRFGKAEWLQPYTAPTLAELGASGLKRVDVICPGFVADCLETLEEIAMEGKQAFMEAGGKSYHYIPCLNATPDWIAALGDIAEQHMIGWPTVMPPIERDAQRKALEIGREEALKAGAAN